MPMPAPSAMASRDPPGVLVEPGGVSINSGGGGGGGGGDDVRGGVRCWRSIPVDIVSGGGRGGGGDESGGSCFA